MCSRYLWALLPYWSKVKSQDVISMGRVHGHIFFTICPVPMLPLVQFDALVETRNHVDLTMCQHSMVAFVSAFRRLEGLIWDPFSISWVCHITFVHFLSLHSSTKINYISTLTLECTGVDFLDGRQSVTYPLLYT